MPGTATGTVLCNDVTVARATSSGVAFFLQSNPKYNKNIFVIQKNLYKPAVTIFGLRSVPSKKT
jgi:hypothetical protein